MLFEGHFEIGLSRLLDKASIYYNLLRAIFSQVSGGSKLANPIINETS